MITLEVEMAFRSLGRGYVEFLYDAEERSCSPSALAAMADTEYVDPPEVVKGFIQGIRRGDSGPYLLVRTTRRRCRGTGYLPFEAGEYLFRSYRLDRIRLDTAVTSGPKGKRKILPC